MNGRFKLAEVETLNAEVAFVHHTMINVESLWTESIKQEINVDKIEISNQFLYKRGVARQMSKVKLEEILNALEFAGEEGDYYYNKITGEVVYIGGEEARIADRDDIDNIDHYPEWQREIIKDAIDIEENWDNYISLPSKFDINEYNIMVEFCDSLDNGRKADQLLNALNGRGAFRKFKDTIIRLNVEKKWYNYRDEALRNVAMDWCKENGIEEIDDDRLNIKLV